MNHANGKYGHFDMGRPGTYVINTLNLPTSWEYIYQNKDVLLRVDQYGPVNAQAYPPQDIVLFTRTRDERYSKWLVWFQCDELNNGVPFNNFFRSCPAHIPDFQPEQVRITFEPQKAEYYFLFEGLEITTHLMVPERGCDIIMSVSVNNKTNRQLSVRAFATMLPFISPAQLAPWDKPEWYLKSGVGIEEELVFFTQMFHPDGQEQHRRAVTLWSTREDSTSFDIIAEEFCGAGDFTNPESVYRKVLNRELSQCDGYGEFTDGSTLYGYPPVYAAGYEFDLPPGCEKVIRQVMSLQPPGENHGLPKLSIAQKPLRFFDDAGLIREQQALQEFFQKLFTRRSISTRDKFFDYYVNSWLPLQMYWVAVLDRGWPTGMRGTRDGSNDFMGMLPLDTDWTRRIILELLSCQRTDGWFPRQVSTLGKNGKHDLREYVDGGAFFLELLYEYLCFTGDTALLDETCSWLDSDRESTVLAHMLSALEYYLEEENIGEHGLCKIRGGDWLDPVSRAGLLGRGESVMVTCQVVMALEYVSRILNFINKETELLPRLAKEHERFRNGLLTHALNKEGFFNSVFNDDGNWLFSDLDPDGACRPYIPSNAYAIISGVARDEQAERIVAHTESLKFDAGYHLYWPPIGDIKIEKLGRSGGGDVPAGLSENATPYNHGSHGFLGRAYAKVGEREKLFDVMQFMLPYDREKHPTEQAKSPPYAVTNCWHQVPVLPNRSGMLFLTGSIAMALRMVYNWIMGIEFGLDFFSVNPVVSDKLGDVAITLEIRGVQRAIRISEKRLYIDGREITPGEKLPY